MQKSLNHLYSREGSDILVTCSASHILYISNCNVNKPHLLSIMDGSLRDKDNPDQSSKNTNGVSQIAMRTVYDFYTKTHYLHGDERSIEKITGIDEATWKLLKNDSTYQPPYAIIKKLLDLGWSRFFLENGEGALFKAPKDSLDVVEANFHYLRHLYQKGSQ